MLNVRLKRYLNDLIDYTYPDATPQELRKYKGFRLYISLEERTTRGGYYDPSSQTIVLHNMRHGNDFAIFGSIHELAHHMDWCVNGKCCGHQKPFYIEYKKLIFTALNMGLVSMSVYTDHSYGYKRERHYLDKWLEEYEYEYIDYIPKYPPVIKIYNSFGIKDELKEQRYTWNPAELLWEKEAEDLEKELAFLQSLNVMRNEKENDFIKKPYYVLEESDFAIDPYVYIEAKGDTYELRELLKEYGFYFKKQGKKWLKKCKSSDYQSVIAMLKKDEKFRLPMQNGKVQPHVTFDVEKRKAVKR